jgi:cytochrome c
MKRVLSLLIVGSALLLAPVAHAAGQATPEEAKAMAIKAASYLQSSGPETAFPAFSAKDGPWHDRDLYVLVENDQHIMVAHGSNPALIGRNVLNLKDPEGKSVAVELDAIKDAGWVDFKWLNPVTKAIEPKTLYAVRVGEYHVAVGAYAR